MAQYLQKLILCIIALMAMTYQTHCLRWGVSVKKDQPTGLCQSSIMIHGYKCQEVHVATKDGFILNLQRIPTGRIVHEGNHKSRRPPVLLQHGVLVDGMTWLMNSPEQNLPMILADKGFDVWISNTRGTRFSRRHKSLKRNQPEFWNWTWDELVEFDLPAMTNHIYKVTGQKMHYVGHSMGTLILLASLSEGRLLNRLKSAALLSPIAYLSHMTSPLSIIGAKAFLGELVEMFGVAEFNPGGKSVADFINFLCNNPRVNCYDIMATLTGNNCCLDSSTIALFLKHEPQSTSTKNLVHFSQTVRDGVLTKFNYDTIDQNLKHYQAASPPIYNLSNIPHSFPIFLSYGNKDALSDTTDVIHLLDHFKFHDKNKINIQIVKKYAHVDFIMGLDAKDIVYKQVVSFFKQRD